MVKVYHGTCDALWSNPGGTVTGTIYLTTDRSEAAIYADSATSNVRCDLKESDWGSVNWIIVEFDLSELVGLVDKTDDMALEPDWGWEDGFTNETDPTWEQSMQSVGSFCISGFEEHHKALGRIIDPSLVA